jgi:hypothetical protein
MDKFIDNIDAFSTALPIEAAAVIMHMSLVFPGSTNAC